jgi:hypothetical protein
MTRVLSSALAIILAVSAWESSYYLFEWIGLDAFDPLDRVCLLILLLSLSEAIHRKTAQRPAGSAQSSAQT